MNSLNIIIIFIYINLIFYYYLDFDVKGRRIPNKSFYFFFLFGLGLIHGYEGFSLFLVIRLFFILIILFFCFVLYNFRIIGGGDAKLVILIFLLIPEIFLNFLSIYAYFFILIMLFLILYLTNLYRNRLRKNSLIIDNIIFLCGITDSVKSIYVKIFLKSIDCEQFKPIKHKIVLNYFFFNPIKRKLQVLSYYNPPLTMLCIISYYLLIIYMSLNRYIQ